MRITRIECIPVQAPGRTLVPVVVDTDSGLCGVGEAGLQRRWQAVAGAVQHLEEWLVGQDPFRIEHLWQRMFRGGFYPGDRLIGSAIAAIDIALWDLKAQALGVPVYELLGGRCREYVEVFTAPDFLPEEALREIVEIRRRIAETADPQATAELARCCANCGHRYFRLGPPVWGNRLEARQSVRQLIEQLRAVRAAVGDRLELMVDLHTRLTPEEAVWFCGEVEPLQLFAVEDPIRSEHPAGYRQVRQRTRVPLAAGEQWASKWEFRQAIEEEWIDYARVDLCIAGGLSEGKKIATLAETHLIKILPHNPLGPVCTAASLHLDLACDNAGPQEVLFSPATLLPEVFQCSFDLKDMALTLPEGPGLGVRFDRQAARRYPPEMTEPPHFARQDGSFTNY
ncbi:MAG: mandelate racemase/muconate lactonizing enzyme family protein [Candidatus Latescibacteria bacterium]|nr:mandelate racemase/muconate lactonizing enzyme family protein [Candidatus Latescibacterota bacterium]